MNKKEIEVGLLICKILVFLYIITSPLINQNKYIPFMNTLVAKILFLILIIVTGFIDIQLSILLAIALFVMIINFNKDKILKVNQESHIHKSVSIPILSENKNIQQRVDKVDKPDVIPYVNDTMYDFPNEICNTQPFEDTSINTDLMSHYIDSKTKPYESYIRQMTNSECLNSVQTNELL